ncbi:helix-turn-helix transcriptional regulator [Lentisphaerota bacterium ZTH]|nr:helix-turn-helix transcriptional regulator [Lentisphaerota bacterium]WET05928.1 helix-turn-helix transcriptional regulator [Lentisphaerota bacterium ZTH]
MIKKFLKKHKISASELAQIARFTRSSVSRWISGERQMPEHAELLLELLEYYKSKEGDWPK